jgi:aminopeptidase C
MSSVSIVDWNALLSNSEDVDEMFNTFIETFLIVTKECIPTKMVTVRNSDRPWFNSELRREIRKRDCIRKTVKKYSKQSEIDKYKKHDHLYQMGLSKHPKKNNV